MPPAVEPVPAPLGAGAPVVAPEVVDMPEVVVPAEDIPEVVVPVEVVPVLESIDPAVDIPEEDVPAVEPEFIDPEVVVPVEDDPVLDPESMLVVPLVVVPAVVLPAVEPVVSALMDGEVELAVVDCDESPEVVEEPVEDAGVVPVAAVSSDDPLPHPMARVARAAKRLNLTGVFMVVDLATSNAASLGRKPTPEGSP